MVRLNFADIQGNILRGYNFGAGAHYFISVPDAGEGRRLLRDVLLHVTDGRDWGGSRPVIAVNVALTFAGLKVLGVESAVLEDLPQAFQADIAERARCQLGDIGPSDPAHWEPEWRQEDHILVLLASSETAQSDDPTAAFNDRFPRLANARRWLECRVTQRRARIVRRQEVAALNNHREHFGYADGSGQPAVEGVPSNWPGQGVPEPETGAWRDIKAGEFIMGYPNEDGESLSGPAWWLKRNGSFMVYRKLQQDVAQFQDKVWDLGRRWVETKPAALSGATLSTHASFELMAAKLAGRWRDGTAIELNQRLDELASLTCLQFEMDRHLGNNFRYGSDTEYVCPRGAHIRRANPRDLLGRDGQESRRHRIIRRGMPYGKPYLSDVGSGKAPNDDGDRGLIFMCFNADLERQFEVVQGQWCADGNVFHLGDDQDFLLGNRAGGKVTIEGHPPFFVPSEPGLVVTRGCRYLLMPGLGALHRLSAPRWDRAIDLEHVPPEEPDAITRVVGLVTRGMHEQYASSRPMRRGQHPKSHGAVVATFEVPDDVPEDLRIGLFARPRRYQAWIRFSASHAGLQSDTKLDAQGMAIKVMGVPGEKVLPRARWLDTQDFVLVNHESFFLRHAIDVAGFAQVVTPTGSVRHLPLEIQLRAVSFFLTRRNLRGLGTLQRMLACEVANPLGVKYWSETPYSLQRDGGPSWAVKYSVWPTAPVNGLEPEDYNSLEAALARSLGSPDARFQFEFRIQRQADPHTMPVEDPTVRWSDSDSPYRRVAMITIEHQDILAQQRRNVAENIVFTPWHSLWEHRPLGGINRVRRAVYEASSNLRHELNNVVRHEGDDLLSEGREDKALFLGRIPCPHLPAAPEPAPPTTDEVN